MSRFDDKGECPAVEVIKHNNPHGHFGDSTEPRSPRSPRVKLRVGQVIRHKKWGYRGVVIGWDEKLKVLINAHNFYQRKIDFFLNIFYCFFII